MSRILSPAIGAGARWKHVVFFPLDTHLHLELDVETAAAFTFERIERFVKTDRWAMHMRVRNHSDAPKRFQAHARLLPDPRPLADRLLELARHEFSRPRTRAS